MEKNVEKLAFSYFLTWYFYADHILVSSFKALSDFSLLALIIEIFILTIIIIMKRFCQSFIRLTSLLECAKGKNTGQTKHEFIEMARSINIYSF